MSSQRPPSPPAEAPAEPPAELVRLRELVGPDESAYATLKVELLAARDHALGAEAEAGELRGQLRRLERELEAHRLALLEAESAVHELSLIRGSLSWRLARLLSAPARWLRGS